jgi:predicted nucleic acid-binding protein
VLVLDASAVVDLLLRNPRGRRVAERLDDALVAPDLLDVEVTSAFARLVRADSVSADDARRALAGLVRLPARRVHTALLVASAWELRQVVRVADAFYVACAAVLGVPLLTTDTRIGGASVPGVTVVVVR